MAKWNIPFHSYRYPMAAKDGDGWIECRCGGKHWGLNGAAGLLLIRDRKVMMQHRSPWVHNGDTWGLPGGARDSHESIQEAAIREAKNGNIESPIAVVVLRLRQVIQKTGLAPSSIYTRMQSGEFPKSIRLTARSVGWRFDEVAKWIEDRTEISNKLEWSAS